MAGSLRVGGVMKKNVLAMLLVAGFPALAAAEDCFLMERECTEPAETRVINGVSVTRDCWAYRDVYSCLTKSADSEDGCSTLNAAAKSYQCDKTSYACDKSLLALNGAYRCLHETETWQCSGQTITLPSVNAEWTGKEIAYDERIDANTCQAYAADAACVKSERTCSQEGKLADGYGDCTQTYLCQGRKRTACTDLQAAGCTQIAAPACADGTASCLTKTGTVSCAGVKKASGFYASIIPSTVDARDYTVTSTATTSDGSPKMNTDDCLAYADGTLDSGCTEAASTCTEKGGIKKINGRAYYQKCWGYSKTYNCSARDYSTCGALEASAVASLCSLVSESCSSTDATTGDCILRTKIYKCSERAAVGEAVLKGSESVLAGYQTADGCASEKSDSTCQLAEESCEAYSSAGDGTCVQKRLVYQCQPAK